MSTRPGPSGFGLRVRRLELHGAAPALGERFAAALDAQLALRGVQRVEVDHLRLDARSLRPADAAGLERLAARVADSLSAAAPPKP